MRGGSLSRRLLLLSLAAVAVVWVASSIFAVVRVRHEAGELLDAHLVQGLDSQGEAATVVGAQGLVVAPECAAAQVAHARAVVPARRVVHRVGETVQEVGVAVAVEVTHQVDLGVAALIA